MNRKVIVLLLLAVLPLCSWAGQGVRYYRDIILYPVREQEDASMIEAMTASGLSGMQILDAVQKKYFHEIPFLTNEIKEYQYGAVMVTDDGTNRLIEEPVTGFSILLESVPDGDLLLLKKKTILHFKEVVDRVDYIYRNGKLISAHSRLFGQKELER